MNPQYINELNDHFKNKNSLCDELSWRSQNKTISSNPSDLIIKLDSLGYNFTQKDFDNFIVCSIYKKGRSYIASSPYSSIKMDNRKKVLNIMFTKFTPSEKQLKLLINCAGSGANDWIDVLVKRNYTFNDNQQIELIKIGYDVTKLYTNKTDLSLDEIKALVLSVISKKSKCDDLHTITHNNKIEYPSNFITWILSNHSPQNCYNIKEYTKIFKEILNVFIKQLNLKFDQDSYTHIYKFNSCDFVYYCVDNGFIPTDESMIICSKTKSLIELVFYFHNRFGLKLTTEIMNNMLCTQCIYICKECTGHYSNTYSADLDMIKQMLENFGYSNTLIDKAVVNSSANADSNSESDDGDGISIYKFLRLLNVIPNEETFKLGYMYKRENVVNDCTKTFKMLPTNEHLQLILKNNLINASLDMLNDILCYKILPTKDDFNVFINHHDDNLQALELLIKYGLVLDMDDINKALSEGLIINNLERFNIPYDETLYYYCYVHNIFPYDDKMEIDKKTLALRIMCRTKTTTVDSFIKYIKDNNIMPDKYCFDHTCFYNNELFEHMSKLGCEPTPTIYYWKGLSKCHFNHDYFKNFLNLNKMNKEYMQTKYDIDLQKIAI